MFPQLLQPVDLTLKDLVQLDEVGYQVVTIRRQPHQPTPNNAKLSFANAKAAAAAH